MELASQPIRRRLTAVVGAAAAVASVAIAAPGLSQAAPARSASVAASNCPRAYPVPQVHRGMRATGYTTSQGRQPRPFAARVLGVLRDGIAPGIDLIIIRAHSPAIRRAGGVWAGMSGSPIYARDGRLLGALSYSFSTGPSNTAGVTPASAMYKLFRMGGHAAAQPAAHIHFSAAQQARLVRVGAATPTQAGAGLRPIPTPFTVSGVPARGLARVRKLVRKSIPGPFQLEGGGTVSPQATAPRSTMRPGAPFVASISTGDVTFAGIGTTTAVCSGRVLAFGHPMLGGGSTQMTMHTGNVLYIQRDPVFSPFVMANVGGRTGVVNQDRLTGLRARLGAKPKHLTTLVTRVTADTGLHRYSHSYTALPGWVPDIDANAIYGDMLSTLQKFGIGTAHLGYAILGRRNGGRAFHIRRTDDIASQFDVAYETANALYGPLASLAYNPYRHVRVHRVVANIHVSDRFRQWTVQKLQVRRGGSFQNLRGQRVQPGSTQHLRAQLVETNQIKPVRYLRFTVQVPSDARRFADVEAVGGAQFGGLFVRGGGSFNRLLYKIKHAPRNASLELRLFFGTRRGSVRQTHSIRLDRSTTGFKFGRLRIGSASKA
jgi:hypothetical protein